MIATLFALSLMTQTASTPPVDPAKAAYDAEASRLAARAPYEERCLTMTRLPGESVEACTDRRMALQTTPSAGPDPERAGEARRGCESEGLLDGETLGLCITRRMAPEDLFEDMDLLSGFELTPSAPPPPAPAPPRRRPFECRNETVANEDGSVTEAVVICGNGESDAARNVLESLLRSEDD